MLAAAALALLRCARGVVAVLLAAGAVGAVRRPGRRPAAGLERLDPSAAGREPLGGEQLVDELIAIEPSPTAEATRFIEPWRTSPAAKTPGMLVSSENGLRSSGQPAVVVDVRAGADEAAVVRADSSAGSQSVFGRAPIIRKSASAVDGLGRAVVAVAQVEALQPAVSPAADDLGPEPHLDVGRRLDLLHQVVRHPRVERVGRAPRASPARAYSARCSAAWPAELAPPTT